MNKRSRIYLDYASITPLDKRVLKIMQPFFGENFHNPSSLYLEGRKNREEINHARKKIAHILQVKPTEIFFTSGGTESNNIALQGAFNSLKGKKIHMITSKVEHSSVLEIFKYFETKGVNVTYLSVDAKGVINPQLVIDALREETALISLMYGNNEIGTINNISKISKLISKIRKEKKQKPVIFHTDASQGACYLNIRADYLGADLITIDGTKLYGPRGCGVLYIKRGTPISPIIFGGGHEEGIRSGTENTPSIIGLAEALTICQEEKDLETKRLIKLRDYAVNKLRKSIPDLVLNGSQEERLPNNINICLPGIDSEFMVIKLDLKGIACSSVTTCKNLMDDSSSYVIEDLDAKCAKSSLRISLGRFTTKNELDKALKIIIKTYLHIKSN